MTRITPTVVGTLGTTQEKESTLAWSTAMSCQLTAPSVE